MIKDNSNNSYTIEIELFRNENSDIKVSSYAIIRSVDMDVLRKKTLENEIIADAPKGMWQFASNTIEVGKQVKARLYLTDAIDSEYKEYNCILQGEIPEGQIATPIQLATWFVMKSDKEEFALYIYNPFELNNGKFIRGYI